MTQKISDLLEQGSQGQHQLIGNMFDLDACCAWGAVHRAITGRTEMAYESALKEALGYNPYLRLVDTFAGKMAVRDVIVNLNDESELTFAEIIAWLRECGL